jgi:hypothetical protein
MVRAPKGGLDAFFRYMQGGTYANAACRSPRPSPKERLWLVGPLPGMIYEYVELAVAISIIEANPVVKAALFAPVHVKPQRQGAGISLA